MKYLLTLFMVCMMLASINTHAGGPGRGFSSSSSRSSFGGGFRSSSFGGGFRSSSSPSYRSFSSSPSRTFTYRSSPAAPRASYSSPAAPRSTYRSSNKTTVNNHYHGGASASGSSGLGLMDYVILDNILGRDRGPAYVSQAPVVHQQPVTYTEGVTGAVVYREETHYWRNFLLLVLGLGLLYGIYRLIKAVELVN